MARPIPLLAVAIDSCCWEYLQPLLDGGRCPTLAALASRGARGRVNSAIIPVSPTAWSSFITGKTPAHHGVFEWQVRKPGGLLVRPVTAADRHGAPFWEYINAAGRRVGVVAIPVTYPAPALNGFFFSGFDTPPVTTGFAHPPDLFAALGPALAARTECLLPVRARHGPSLDGVPEADFDRALTDATIEWQRRLDVDCLVINYMSFDHLNHSVRDVRVLHRCLENIDAQIARLLEAVRPESTLVFSDHGAVRNAGAFALSRVLDELGLVRYRELPTGGSACYQIARRLLAPLGGGLGLIERAAIRAVYELLTRAPTRAYESFCRWLASRRTPYLAFAGNEAGDSKAVATINGAIYFNRAAFASDTEWRDARDRLAQRLRGIGSPDNGEPYFTDVRFGEEVFAGPYRELAPDLLAVPSWEKFAISLTHFISPRGRINEYFTRNLRNVMEGGHSQFGLYIADGPAFRRGQTTGDVDIHGLPQIILHALGIAVPDDFDAAFPAHVFDEQYIARHPPARQPARAAGPPPKAGALSDEQERIVRQRLQELGYIE